MIWDENDDPVCDDNVSTLNDIHDYNTVILTFFIEFNLNALDNNY